MRHGLAALGATALLLLSGCAAGGDAAATDPLAEEMHSWPHASYPPPRERMPA